MHKKNEDKKSIENDKDKIYDSFNKTVDRLNKEGRRHTIHPMIGNFITGLSIELKKRNLPSYDSKYMLCYEQAIEVIEDLREFNN